MLDLGHIIVVYFAKYLIAGVVCVDLFLNSI